MNRGVPQWLPRPSLESAELVVPPPAKGPGNWAGAPAACLSDGTYYLAYRLRRKAGNDRGYAVVIARSEDGIEFDTIGVLAKEDFGAESLERPCLVQLEDGSWRLYMSCATPNSAHWWVDAIDAPSPKEFDPAKRVSVMAGDDLTAVKDPVVVLDDRKWST